MPEQTIADIRQGEPARRRLPDERKAITHKFDIVGFEGYLTVGLFEDGTPGEIFLVLAKEGSTISGFADAFARAVSIAFQYGVPLQVLVDTFSHVRFEPSGMTKNPEVRFTKSIVDYIFRWMEAKFLKPLELPLEAPPCNICGAIMTRSGSGWKCSNCGHTTT
ncbi:MAG: hypothetical protein HYT68_01490 [Candidatus Zambryskibacteria bacterium]|nr:hypothetical protein [Candidatus Zambryskibacteria bacterium]